jgi:hypothetical protein
MQLKGSNSDINILASHCYSVPAGYTKSGKSYEDIAQVMHINAEKSMNLWLKDFDGVASLLTIKEKKTIAEQLIAISDENKIELIVIGAKGQTKGSMVILGSTTMDFIKLNDKIPVFIVKKEGEHLNILDALMRL